MTKSTITREQAQKIIVAADEVITALAGTNEDVHPDDSKKMCELWDDLNDRHAPPVVVRELARMALAAMDSKPVAWTWHYREKWHVTNDERRAEFVAKDGDVAVLPLYRHAQPVLEIESEPVFTLEVARADYKGQKLGNHFGFITLDAARELKEGNYQLYTAQPVPVVPDGYVMVPMRLTAENGAKGALSGEFSETKFVNCPECFGDDECETCDGSWRIEITVPVTWTTIKEIWAKGVEHFAAAPQEPKP
ncbi:DUF550 domain-containing protein [Klebsiella pneumoniae]